MKIFNKQENVQIELISLEFLLSKNKNLDFEDENNNQIDCSFCINNKKCRKHWNNDIPYYQENNECPENLEFKEK